MGEIEKRKIIKEEHNQLVEKSLSGVQLEVGVDISKNN